MNEETREEVYQRGYNDGYYAAGPFIAIAVGLIAGFAVASVTFMVIWSYQCK